MKAALDISKNIIAAIRQAATVVIPQFCESIIKEKGGKSHIWKRILQVEDLRKFHVEDTTVIIREKKKMSSPSKSWQSLLSYNLIGKITFYLTLCENLGGELNPIGLDETKNAKRLFSFHGLIW